MNDLLRQVMKDLSQVIDWSGGPSSREVLARAGLVDEGHRILEDLRRSSKANADLIERRFQAGASV